jgi:hypothetical protein
MPKYSVVIDRDATVGCHDEAIASHHKRIDFYRTGFARLSYLIKVRKNLSQPVLVLPCCTRTPSQSPRLIRVQALTHVNQHRSQLIWMVASDLFNSRSAYSAEKDTRLPLLAINQYRSEAFRGNSYPLLHQNLGYAKTLDHLLQHGGSARTRLFGRGSKLNTSTLGAFCAPDLALEHNVRFQFPCNLEGFFG